MIIFQLVFLIIASVTVKNFKSVDQVQFALKLSFLIFPIRSIFVCLPPGGGELPYEEYTGVCHELGSYFQEKIPKRVCQIFTKIPERAIISDDTNYFDDTNDKPKED